MFTITDICNIAVQIEKNGEESYQNASKAVKDQDVANMLQLMAEEEKCHAKWFENLQSNRALTAEQLEIEAMGKSLLQEMVKGNTFLLSQNDLERAETVLDVLTTSQTFEQDTILFYEFILGVLDDQETIQQLKNIIEEERNHLRQLEHTILARQNLDRTTLPC